MGACCLVLDYAIQDVMSREQLPTITLRCTKPLLLAEGPLVGAKRLEMASNAHACLHNTGVVSGSITYYGNQPCPESRAGVPIVLDSES